MKEEWFLIYIYTFLFFSEREKSILVAFMYFMHNMSVECIFLSSGYNITL